jgi:DNA mismatch repair protein MutS
MYLKVTQKYLFKYFSLLQKAVGIMENLTPAMKQYMEIKGKYKDCIIFFRMGDFYETFYDDAKTTSEILDIALTKRGIKNSKSSIPLAGIPFHALDSYLPKMIKAGKKIAIVEQLEDPRFAKGIVKRDVVRVITPGTITEQNILGKDNNYLASLIPGKMTGFSVVDLSTGEFFCGEMDDFYDSLSEVMKFFPSEVLLPISSETDKTIVSGIKNKGGYLTFVSDVNYFYENAKNTLLAQFGALTLDGFGLKGKDSAISSAGALISYLKEVHKGQVTHINSIKYYSKKDFLHMDMTTIENLELINNPKDEKGSFTLLSVLDKTLTPMGMRLLKKFLVMPLADEKKINERLLSVEDLMSKHFILEEIKDLLKNISDLERLIARVNLGTANPRDLVTLQGSLELIPDMKKLMEETSSVLLEKISMLEDVSDICMLIDTSIIDDPPVNMLEGGFIKSEFNEELARLRDITTNAKKIISVIEEKERHATGIRSLKIRYNRIFGYYMDITKPNLHLVPSSYIKRQTLVNSERFITEELKKLEEEILTAEEKINSIEQEIFTKIIDMVKSQTAKIQSIADNIAYLDVLCSFASVSSKNKYAKPHVDNGFKLKLKKSRHPVIEQGSDFIANDINLSPENRMMIITGPNMAGKSVYMRQIALNIIMAQAGCFVACDEADIGITDKIFCRTGAGDDISRGKSTFMVEMSETAEILNNATENSFIILDEIGRGTSTFDGVAIAWSVATYLAEKIKAKTLFATHYHVLNELEKEIPCIKNYNIAVEEKEDRIIFLRRILPGGTDKSYGIHVAKLAGMPKEVIEKSKAIQFKLENDDNISEKIIIETRKKKEKDKYRNEIEEVERLIKSRQKRLDEV